MSDFITRRSSLQHSAKGTSWEKKDHKYTKKEDGKYYYTNNKSTQNSSASSSGYTEEELLELSKKDPSELTDEEIEAVYQFPDKVKENIKKKKDSQITDKLATEGKRVLDELSYLLELSLKGVNL